MILCLDAGNTRLKWGLRDNADWRARDVLAYPEVAAFVPPARPQRILACNVAGPTVAAQIETLAMRLTIPLTWFRSAPAACGVRNGYAHFARLGADRWAALIAARALHPGTALVVMAGTATTIDVLDADGLFRGGLILPGLDLMKRSLARNTAGLPDAQGTFRDIPTHTDDAIVSGALQATLGAIERMSAIARRHASADFCMILSGGAGDALAPHLDLPLLRAEHLVLEGLARFSTGAVW